ncbi:hypothetical protein Pmani_001322 [Petrolisthes manimaculis]|uniref:RING-type domain-containing protein n=1 Tax=Petrolisthes manimaculis TaxID=1843537 RepID=A0AAE1QK52_9EUCA|nr:hypothetical protein Pmani_001322 [Petrolisthes manimaculis]
MESLDQALEVVKGVVALICEKLGSDAKEHINHDQVFVRAEHELQNGLDVAGAIDSIGSSLMWDVQEKLEDQIICIKRIREELVRDSKYVINDNTGKNEKVPEKEVQQLDKDEQQAMDVEVAGSSGANTNSDKSSTNVNDNKGDSPQLPTSPEQPDDDDDDDDDIRVLTPVPPSPAPLIVLTDDSSDISNPSSSSVSIVKEEPGVNMTEIRNHLMNEIDLQDAENIGFARKDIATLRKEEMSATDTSISVETNAVKIEDKVEPIVHHNGDVAFDYSVNGIINGQKEEKTNKEKVQYNVEDNSAAISTLKNGCKKEKRDLIYFLNNNPMDYENPVDALWEEAHFMCSVLPYFELAHVHQSLMDHFYHPDRRAYVLEEYYNLALHRDEEVPDVVFHGLLAARKRSYAEVDDTEVAGDGKKMKTSASSDHQQTAAIGMQNFPDNSQPSTSGSNNPLTPAPVVADMSTAAKSFSDSDYGNTLIESGPVKVDKAREQWCKDKLEFVRAVVYGVHESILCAQIKLCFTDEDIERLVDRLLLEQEKGGSDVAQGLVERGNPVSAVQVVLPGSSAFNIVDKKNKETPFAGVSLGASEDTATPGTSGGAEAEDPADLEDRIAAQMATLSEMFTDADPDYLQQRCADNNGDQVNFQALVDELIKNKNYPKIEEYNKRKKRLEIKKKFIEGMSVEEFLDYFEDPEKVFTDTSTVMSKTYIENSRAQVKRDLPYHFIKDIENVLRKHNHHYLPTLRALQNISKVSRRKTKRSSQVKESDLDDIFIKELCYSRMQTEIKEHLLKKESDKRRALLWAKATHQLVECTCCYDDEVLEDDMDTCTNQETKHKFCNNCIRRFAEEEIGQGRTTFRCLEGSCKAEFSLSTLKNLMKPSVFSNILERKQLEEIAAAGIEDLVACPFCNFQTIMPDKEDKVFKCLNPECMKDSCRFCQEPNHVPLRCEEVERQHQMDARTFMENKMTEAMVRECWKCKKRFIKEDGCNKMRCSCGAMMCYICKKPIKGYDHFEDKTVPTDSSKCPLWSNSEKIHAEEVRDAADKLKKDMDPNLNLVHNPLNDVPEVPKHLSNKLKNFRWHHHHHHHHHHRHHHHHHHHHHPHPPHHHPPAAHQNRQEIFLRLPAQNLALAPLHPANPPHDRVNPVQFMMGPGEHNQLPPPAHQNPLRNIRFDRPRLHHRAPPPPPPPPLPPPLINNQQVFRDFMVNEINQVLQRMNNP